jgi:hypothetical protein
MDYKCEVYWKSWYGCFHLVFLFFFARLSFIFLLLTCVPPAVPPKHMGYSTIGIGFAVPALTSEYDDPYNQPVYVCSNIRIVLRPFRHLDV